MAKNKHWRFGRHVLCGFVIASIFVFAVVTTADASRRVRNTVRGAAIGAGVGALMDGGSGAQQGAAVGAVVGAVR